MHLEIKLNPRHGNDRIVSFFEGLHTSSHHIVLVFEESDLKNPDGEPSLENLGITKHLQNLVHGVIFKKSDGSTLELYKR